VIKIDIMKLKLWQHI